MATVKHAVGGAVAIVAIIVAGAIVVVAAGFYDVAATREHTRLVYDGLRWGLRRSIAHHAERIRAPRFDASMTQRGLVEYHEHCSRCHGAPGIAPEAFALGMAPPPINLVHAARTYSPAEIFWTIKNGIKMTGMPAWEYRLDDDRIWAITAFVANALPSLSPVRYRERLEALSGGAATGRRPHGAPSRLDSRSTPEPSARPSVPEPATAPAQTPASSAEPFDDRSSLQRDPSSASLVGLGGFGTMPPVLGDPARGARAIPQYACTTCHTIPGIVGRPVRVGPPLRGIALRSYLGGELPNTPGNMVRWLLDPQAAEPHSAMPSLGLTPRDAADIAAYLYTLDRP
ncbi:MAG TPA: c-type cytochrome [Gammaproteobacteria bacterium]|nr:c-type cytochrome [Gammaproteobacteria bacterium]